MRHQTTGKVHHRPSAVPARLGLKALALAWPEGALAFQNPRPSCGSRLRLGHGLAWPRLGLLQQIPYLVCAHYCYLARAAHTSIDVGMRARKVTSGVGWHLFSLLWGAVLWGHPLWFVFVCKGRGQVVLKGMVVGVCIVGSSCCERNGMAGCRGREVQEVGHMDLK